jgi:hypothetical protein
LAAISNGHLYNLRRHPHYRQRRQSYHKTRPNLVPIGERRQPDPQGRPGYLRVDTVHQGDTENAKGVYHINAVDEVTQWEIAASVERISEAYLEPVLATLLTQFPFVIHGFHSRRWLLNLSQRQKAAAWLQRSDPNVDCFAGPPRTI